MFTLARLASIIASVSMLVACSSSEGNGTGHVTSDINAPWSNPSGGPGVGAKDVLERVPWDMILDGHCPNPRTEYQCANGNACCPNGTQCCEAGSSSGMCATDCSLSYDRNGCPAGYPSACGDVCCRGACDASGNGCAASDTTEGTSSGSSGSSGSTNGSSSSSNGSSSSSSDSCSSCPAGCCSADGGCIEGCE
jgi:hypothetical protein